MMIAFIGSTSESEPTHYTQQNIIKLKFGGKNNEF